MSNTHINKNSHLMNINQKNQKHNNTNIKLQIILKEIIKFKWILYNSKHLLN